MLRRQTLDPDLPSHPLSGRRHMSRPLWFVQLIKKTFPRRFLVARVTRVPIVARIFERWLFEGDDLIYLPKDQVI